MAKRFFALLLAALLCASFLPNASAFSLGKPREYDGRFTDVPDDAWFAEYVSDCYSLGLIDGRTTSTFAPNENIKLSEAIKLAAVLRRAYLGGDPFRQNRQPWYSVYVDYAIASGIIDEAPANLNANATRMELAELIAAALPISEYPEINRVDNFAIPDVRESDAVYILYRAGVLTGGDDHSFRPDDYIRRSEVAAILSRAAQDSRRVQFSLVLEGEVISVESENVLADEAFRLTNEFRVSKGLSELKPDDSLAEAASIRAKEIAELFSHTRPNGKSCFSAFDECGVNYVHAGENIASGFVNAKEALDGWIASTVHYENICGDYTRMAVGCYIAEDGMIYWTQLFVR